MKKFSKKPSFKSPPPEGSSITEFAVPIFGFKGHIPDTVYIVGTAVIISDYLAITAKHVINDLWENFEGNIINSDEHASFFIQVVQTFYQTKKANLWDIVKIWTVESSDLAILKLSPASTSAKSYNFKKLNLDFHYPRIGERISCFGYKNSKFIKKDGSNPENGISVYPAISIGEIIEIHEVKRDSGKLNFPCFQTNARFDGGMSGGPVFDDSGHLIGIICSNIPPYEDGEDHASFVTHLLPMLPIEIDLDREGKPPGIKYPIFDALKEGYISGKNLDKIDLIKQDDGTSIISLLPV